MFYHDIAKERGCSVLDLIDLQGRQRQSYMTDVECTYITAHMKIISKVK